MLNFYTALLQIFDKPETLQLYSNANLQPPKIIDFYAGQDQDPESFSFTALPALYFGWQINYDAEPATATLQFRLAFENLRDTSNLSHNKEKALAFFKMASLTDQVIKSISTADFGTLNLTNEGLEMEPTVTDVYLLDYECMYMGNKKTRQRESLPGEFDKAMVSKRLVKKLQENPFTGHL